MLRGRELNGARTATMEGSMSNGTSKPRRAMQLVGALIAVVGLVASITAHASAQDTQYFSGSITGPDFCINDSLGGPRTYPFDSNRDGVADTCSLPRTRRATVARQNAMELLALDFVARFGQLYARECTDVAESYGNPAAESDDECAAPRKAAAAGQSIPPVPASRVSPVLATTWPSRFFSGPVVTSSTFCLNRSLGGPVTYPLDNNGDSVADICSLPTTRRATIARQNALEQLATERDNFFSPLLASECARLISVTFGEAAAEARDECASQTGRPLPGDDDDDDGGDGGDGDGGSTGGTSGQDDDDSGGTQRPTGPTQSVSAPSATNPGTYSKRAAQDVQLAPGNRQIVVSWDPVTPDDDGSDQDDDPYDADAVFEYVVEYSTSRGMSNSKKLVLNLGTDGSVASSQPDGCGTESAAHSEFQCTITRLTNFTTYYVRIEANRGLSNSTGSGNSSSRDYWTPVLSITPGLAGPPRWTADGDTDTEGIQPLVSNDYGELTAFWKAPVEGTTGILHYTIQWGTSNSFANNCNNSNNCQQERLANSATDYTITGLANNRTYYVRVQASTSNGPGTWSITQSLRLTSDLKDPGRPTNVRLATASPGTSLTVTWEAPAINDNDPAATGYRIQWRNVSDNENWSPSNRQESVDGATTLTYTITGLNGIDRYQVRVLAVNDKAAGPWSSTATTTLGVAGAPFDIVLVPGRRSIQASWTNPTSAPAANNIHIQWDTSRSFASNCGTDASCDESTLSGTDDAEDIDDLASNTVYYIRLRSINTNGPGPWSEVVSAEPGTPIAPTSIDAEEDAANIRNLDLTWSYSDEAGKPDLTGFRVQWRTVGSTSWSSRSLSLAQSGCPATATDHPYCSGGYSYTLPSLSTGRPYEVRVLAVNTYGNGQWSATSGPATPGEDFIPSGVTIAANNSEQTIDASWSAPSSSLTVNSYTVQWRTCGTSGYSCGGWGSSRTTSDGNITTLAFPSRPRNDIYYQARVRANGVGSAGGSSGYAESDRYLVEIDQNDTPSDRADDTIMVSTLS